MRENKYDDPVFFEKYSQTNRSKMGLAGVGEWGDAAQMLAVAREKTRFPQLEYLCCAMEDVEFPEESFDIVLSSLAFHYVADYGRLVGKIHNS